MLWRCVCVDPYQPCTVVPRKVLLTNLDKNPECILRQKKRNKGRQLIQISINNELLRHRNYTPLNNMYQLQSEFFHTLCPVFFLTPSVTSVSITYSFNREKHLWKGWIMSVCSPLLAYASGVQQRLEPEPDNNPLPDDAECKPWARGTGPAAWRYEHTVYKWRIFKKWKIQPHWHTDGHHDKHSEDSDYPWPPLAANISWKGNCRWRSLSIISTHLGSPGWLSNS